MKMYLAILLILLMIGCKREPVDLSEVIYDLRTSKTDLLADGSTIDVWVYLNPDADADKRNVIFSSKGGQFLPAKDTITIQKATFENNSLIARVKFTLPSTPGAVIIKARPEFQNRIKFYQISNTLALGTSIPATIRLQPSALGLKTGFDNEITLTATLKNKDNGNVSSGFKVLFEDLFMDGKPANGKYRVSRDIIDGTSTATTTYTAGTMPVGTALYLRATLLNPDGSKTNITDQIIITITD